MEYKRLFNISIELSEYDAKAVKSVIKRLAHAEKGIKEFFIDKVGGIITPINRLQSLINNSVVNRKICELIESNVGKQGIKISVRALKVEKQTENSMFVKVSLSVSYSEFATFAKTMVKKNNNDRMTAVAIPIIEILCQTIPDELKDKLVMEIVKATSNEICSQLSEMLEQNTELKIVFDKLDCDVKED